MPESTENGETTDGQHQSELPPETQSKFTADEARETALQRELASVRKINQVIEEAVASLEKARGNMEVVLGVSVALYAHIPRQCHGRSTTPPACSTPGRASSRRRSTTSDLF